MSDYYLLITDAGKALEVAAHASGEPVSLTDFAVGDGGGSPVTPDATQTALTNETFRDVLSSLNVSVNDASVLEAECIIPASSGGYTIREIGIFASDGTLYAVGNFAEQEKPAPDSGYAASLKILADLVVSDTRDITLTIQDGSYLTETQADTIYLRQDKLLSEIAGQGAEAQQEARQHLGLKSAATADVQTSRDDTTAGRVLVNGGAIAVRSTKANATGGDVADSNDLPSNSVSFVYGGATNSPGISGSLLDFSGIGGGYNVQMAAEYSNDGKSFKFRTRNGDAKAWNAWYEFYHTGKKPTASDVKALPITGGTLTGDLYVQSGTSKTIGLYTRPTPSSGMGIELWGSETRPTVLEFKDEDGYHFYSQRNSDGSITISSAGIFSPSSYANFDAKYQAKGSYYTQSESNARYVQSIQLGAEISVPNSAGIIHAGTGSFWSSVNRDHSGADDLNWYSKPIQKNINGVWTTISG